MYGGKSAEVGVGMTGISSAAAEVPCRYYVDTVWLMVIGHTVISTVTLPLSLTLTGTYLLMNFFVHAFRVIFYE